MTKSKASSSSHRVDAARPPRTSFLFVVNELVINSGAAEQHKDLCRDEWFNRIPPRHPSGYVREIPSYVMRYEDGQVKVAEGYNWFRDEAPDEGHWPEGCVYAYHGARRPYSAEVYKAFTIFSCNPQLPILVVDGDVTTGSASDPIPLLFFHPPNIPGVSQAVTEDSIMGIGPGVVKFVAGQEPSWVPSLVPKSYRAPVPNAQPSTGLGGELPIVIGLMAFSEAAGDATQTSNRTNEIFLGGNGLTGRWRDGIWHDQSAPRGYTPSMLDDPRGFLVVVFLDPMNPEGSTRELIHEMEFSRVLVQESPSSH